MKESLYKLQERAKQLRAELEQLNHIIETMDYLHGKVSAYVWADICARADEASEELDEVTDKIAKSLLKIASRS